MAPFVPVDALDAEGGGIFGDNPDIEYDLDADEADVLEGKTFGEMKGLKTFFKNASSPPRMLAH